MNLLQKTMTSLRETFTSRGLILMYHRVAEPDLDPWGLSVSPTHFAEQLEVIKKYFRPLSMQELLTQMQRGQVPNRSVVVTFDDGYADNLLNAKPLLAQYDVPATVFLVTEALVEDRNFWWDDLEWALLQPGTLPEHLELRVNHSKYEWDLGDARGYTIQDRQKDRQRRPWDAPAGTRLAFFYVIWQHLLKLSKPERIEALDAICTWAGMSNDPDRAGRALNKHEVNVLREESLIEVGAHTVTHPSLTVLSEFQQMEEIANSKAQLENIIDHPVIDFSYPHGDYSVKTIDLVHKAGFHSATTTNFKCVLADADPFQLPRFQVDDWSGEEFLRRLARWYVRL